MRRVEDVPTHAASPVVALLPQKIVFIARTSHLLQAKIPAPFGAVLSAMVMFLSTEVLPMVHRIPPPSSTAELPVIRLLIRSTTELVAMPMPPPASAVFLEMMLFSTVPAQLLT